MTAQALSTAAATSAAGAIGSARSRARGSRIVCEDSQFWQNGQCRSQPSIPNDSARAPGMKWKNGFFSMGSTATPATYPHGTRSAAPLRERIRQTPRAPSASLQRWAHATQTSLPEAWGEASSRRRAVRSSSAVTLQVSGLALTVARVGGRIACGTPGRLSSLQRAAPHGGAGFGGRIAVPPSKSLTQRALVAAALAPGSRIVRPLDARDPRLLFDALRAAGFSLTWEDGEVRSSARSHTEGAELLLGNNGTGARFLLAQLAATPGRFRLDGDQRLRQRPIAPLAEALRSLGARISPVAPGDGGPGTLALPLVIDGGALAGGEVSVDAASSGQFVSALMLLAPRLRHGLTIRLTAPPPSRPYLDLTEEVLAAFDVAVTRVGECEFHVPAARLRATTFTVEGDWSAAAFPMAAAALTGGAVEVEGVRVASRQGDAVVARLLEGIGCTVSATARGVRIAGRAHLPLVADLRDTPDLFPPLAVVTAALGGRLEGLAGLAVKESDRLRLVTDLLERLGYDVAHTGDSFTSGGGVPPVARWRGALSPEQDHRVAMALAVAGAVTEGVVVEDAACVSKSWPEFWDAWEKLFVSAS